jgi:hypothetical protein
MIWNDCARLMANAIIYFNSMLLNHLLKHFEEVGVEEKAAIIRQVSPVALQNVNLNGTYNFTSTKKLPDLYELAPTPERDKALAEAFKEIGPFFSVR